MPLKRQRKAVNNMAEYIEREAVLKIIADNCPHDKCGYNTEEEMGAGAACYYIMKDVDNLPTADVVPKSEVEKLNKELDELAEEHSDLIVEKDQLFVIAEMQKIEIEALKIANEKMYAAIEATKADVASEILAEIENILDPMIQLNYAISVQHADPIERAKAISAEQALRAFRDYVAELKKKYTESEKEK